MKIVACMKETPSTTAEKRFGSDMRLERRKEDAIINPFDEYTIEEGLRQLQDYLAAWAAFDSWCTSHGRAAPA